jgi:hypothetical protein
MRLSAAIRRWRPRMSLLTAMLLITIAGMAIKIAQLRLEVDPLRRDLRMLRKSLGQLSIHDESKVHAIAVPSHDNLTWRWRVWIPQGRQITIHYQWGDVPRKGVPSKRNSVTLRPGEQSITLSAMQVGIRASEIEVTLDASGGMVGDSTRLSDRWLLGSIHDSYSKTFEGVPWTTYVAPENEKVIILKRFRVGFRVGENMSSEELNRTDEPTPGFIVWLEQR